MLVRDTGIEVGCTGFRDPCSDQLKDPLNWRHATQYRVSQVEAGGTSAMLIGSILGTKRGNTSHAQPRGPRGRSRQFGNWPRADGRSATRVPTESDIMARTPS